MSNPQDVPPQRVTKDNSTLTLLVLAALGYLKIYGQNNKDLELLRKVE